VADKHKSHGKSGGISAEEIVIIIVVCLALLALALYLYRRWLKRQMHSNMKDQVDEAVRQYIALSESSSN
jgi:flagellar basal body-associated protein FliL